MTVYSLYPGFIKIFYNSNSHDHEMVLPVDPFLSGSDWLLNANAGATTPEWTEFVDDFVLVMKALFDTASDIVSAQLFTMATATADPIFRANYDIGVVGTGGSAAIPFAQARFTYRTHLGGLLIVQLMEAIMPVNQRDTPPLAGATIIAFDDFIRADTFCGFGRDGGTPIALTSMETKVNDKLRQRYIVSS
jgi:hypothetical protein